MKKLLIMLALISFSCSTPEEETTQECQCYKVVYTYEQYYQGGTWQWVYIEVSSEVLNTTNCQETNYVNMGNGNFYRIECR
jgi:hypothetical protein